MSFQRTPALAATWALLAASLQWSAAALAADPTQPTAQAAPSAAGQVGPRELIEDSAQRMLKDLDANRAAYRTDPKLVHKLVDQVLLPNFDTPYAARQVLGPHWRTATPVQRERFIKAFYQSLVENYGTALLEFTADKLVVLPYKGAPDAQSATVRTQVKTSDGTRVPVNYTLHQTPDGWKAWDVTIEGISYVKNFRTDFGAEIDQKGLEAVITRLETEGPKAIPRKSA